MGARRARMCKRPLSRITLTIHRDSFGRSHRVVFSEQQLHFEYTSLVWSFAWPIDFNIEVTNVFRIGMDMNAIYFFFFEKI